MTVSTTCRSPETLVSYWKSTYWPRGALEVSRVSGHDLAPRPERFKGPASLLYCLHPLRLRDRELKRQSRLVPALRDLAFVHEGKPSMDGRLGGANGRRSICGRLTGERVQD